MARAVGVSIAVSAGFVVVFAGAGLLLNRISSSFRTELPWVTIVVGGLLLGAGLAGLAGWKSSVGVALPQLGGSGPGSGLGSMVGYGITYASASLTCTLGPFLAVTGAALNQSLLGGIATYVAYAAGMGTTILGISVGAALARDGLSSRLRLLTKFSSRLGGVLMVLAGVYAIWYGRWELRVYSGDLKTDPVVELGESVRLWFVTRIDQIGASRLAFVVLGLIVASILSSRLTWREAGGETNRRHSAHRR